MRATGRPPANLDPPPRKKLLNPQYVTVTHGMRGYHAVLCDNDGPITSGCGSYETPEDAAGEARDWAEADGLEYKP